MKNKLLFSRLKEIQKNIQNGNPYIDLTEEELVNEFILDIVRDLDWIGSNLSEQLRIEDVGIPDIALFNNNYLKVIVEAKKMNEDLELHKEQLYDYVKATNVKLGVLTNGISWWFFLPRYKDQWRFKKFCEIKIDETPIKTLHNQFIEFLSKENVISPQYSKNARTCIGKFCIDNSHSGITDTELMNRIDNLGHFKELSHENKVLCHDLKFEGSKRNLPDKYCLKIQ